MGKPNDLYYKNAFITLFTCSSFANVQKHPCQWIFVYKYVCQERLESFLAGLHHKILTGLSLRLES